MTTPDALRHMLCQALYLTIVLSAPVLVAVLATGIVTSLLRAMTRIEERTLSTVPKILVAFLTLALSGSWMASELTRFTGEVLSAVPRLGRS